MIRSTIIMRACEYGIARVLGPCSRIVSASTHESPCGDVAIFYGLRASLRQVYRDYRAAGRRTILIDLGFWGRQEGGRFAGYHRFVVDGLHAGHYVNRMDHDPSRVRRFNIERRAFTRRGTHILLYGQSAKAAWVYDLEPEAWERAAIAAIRTYSDRPIIYKPKHSWKEARPIPGVGYSPPTEPTALLLRNCWAVVTHHSNTGLHALEKGVPVFTEDGISTPLAKRYLSEIEKPWYPSERERDQFLANVAWTQWSVAEITNGLPFDFMRSEGML